jgi:hypothetical protein
MLKTHKELVLNVNKIFWVFYQINVPKMNRLLDNLRDAHAPIGATSEHMMFYNFLFICYKSGVIEPSFNYQSVVSF